MGTPDRLRHRSRSRRSRRSPGGVARGAGPGPRSDREGSSSASRRSPGSSPGIAPAGRLGARTSNRSPRSHPHLHPSRSPRPRPSPSPSPRAAPEPMPEPAPEPVREPAVESAPQPGTTSRRPEPEVVPAAAASGSLEQLVGGRVFTWVGAIAGEHRDRVLPGVGVRRQLGHSHGTAPRGVRVGPRPVRLR